MPQLIQSQARGLLSLLTAKTGGIGPPAFEDYLRLTLETGDLYSLNGRQRLFLAQSASDLDNAATGWIAAGGAQTGGIYATVPVGGPGTGNFEIIVPEGELWRVMSVTCMVERVTGSGGALTCGWMFGTWPVQSFAQIGEPSGTVGAGFFGTMGGMCDFLALPGSCPGFFVPRWDLGTLDFDLHVHLVYERLPL